MSRLRTGGRQLAAGPAFTVFSVLTIAFAVGSLTVVYAGANAVLLQAPGIRAPDEVVLVCHST